MHMSKSSIRSGRDFPAARSRRRREAPGELRRVQYNAAAEFAIEAVVDEPGLRLDAAVAVWL